MDATASNDRTLEAVRLRYAADMLSVANVRNPRLQAAMARVPRERFLGEPPWQVVSMGDGYKEPPLADPALAYQDILFALAPDRGLNNGSPSLHAALLHALDVQLGDRVVRRRRLLHRHPGPTGRPAGDGARDRALGEGDKAAGLFSLLNPINHARTRADAHRYKVEPYVVAADIYAAPPHVGRGGWTWYTGSAGWMQRAGVESILGLRLQGEILHLDPCVPKAWAGFELSLRHGSARYEIRVENPAGAGRGIAFAAVDGKVVMERPLCLRLADDGATHRLQVRLG